LVWVFVFNSEECVVNDIGKADAALGNETLNLDDAVLNGLSANEDYDAVIVRFESFLRLNLFGLICQNKLIDHQGCYHTYVFVGWWSSPSLTLCGIERYRLPGLDRAHTAKLFQRWG